MASRAFRQSRGLARLLRYVCSKALEEGGAITEYTIAVDVLGKPQDFKETKDAGVRVEVHRLRKRLADYYEREGLHDTIRIVIPTGQYTPQFVVSDSAGAAKPEVAEDPAVAPPDTASPETAEVEPPPAARPILDPLPHPPALSRITPLQLGIGGGLAVFALVVALLLLRPDQPLDSFWRPVISSANPILICFGNVAGAHHSNGSGGAESITLLEYHGLASETMLVPDAITVSKLTGLLQSKGKRFRVASQSEATFADLQNGPAVLIGLANNNWTERLVGKLRFTLEHHPPGILYLRDSRNPSSEEWSVDYRMPYLSITRDYALVVRVLDPKTEQMVVTAAGLSAFGTLAAGEFLTRPEEFRKIQAVAPKDWPQKNFELVLSTDVIRGKSGHPNIVAAHFW